MKINVFLIITVCVYLAILLSGPLYSKTVSTSLSERKYDLLSFENANIKDIISYVSDVIGVTIIVEVGIKGKVTLNERANITRKEGP